MLIFCCARRWIFGWYWLEYDPDWQYFGWNSTAKKCRAIGPFIKTVAELIAQTVDAVLTVDVGVLAHDGAFLLLVVLSNLLEFLCIF